VWGGYEWCGAVWGVMGWYWNGGGGRGTGTEEKGTR
jgi:hypothetical protein